MIEPGSQTPKPRTAKGAQRVHELASVAAQLFLERGFDAVTIDDLIARVGGSRSTVYANFGDKEGLFKASMLHLCAEIGLPLDALRIDGRAAAEVLPIFGRALAHTALTPRALGLQRLLTIEGRRFPDVAQQMWAVGHHKAIQMLAAWIAQRQTAPDRDIFSSLPAQVLAEQFISMVTSNVKLRHHRPGQPAPAGHAGRYPGGSGRADLPARRVHHAHAHCCEEGNSMSASLAPISFADKERNACRSSRP